jgi:hypothetical protein
LLTQRQKGSIDISLQLWFAPDTIHENLKIKQRSNNMNFENLLLLIFAVAIFVLNRWIFDMKRKRRRDYYRNEYLKSDAWKRKRYVILKRDNWRCVYCGARATQVHHKKCARKNIGKEPIEWLVSVCNSCHDSMHH